MRLVLDTNVVISGLLWGGPPRQLLDLAKANRVNLFTCTQLLAELRFALSYPKFSIRITQAQHTVDSLYKNFENLAYGIVVLGSQIPAVCRDPDDNVVLACADVSNAEYIITGDLDLLALRSYRTIPIVSVTDALRIVVKP
jgi:putative PIN family toxin of toxin-antitoxin system